MTKVYIIDYGMGNLFSVLHAVDACGAIPVLTKNPDDIGKAERVILPGVGAIADGMKGLRELGFIEPLQHYCNQDDKAFLGICLGMQMMMDVSEEFGEHECLGIISGRVQKIDETGIDGTPHRLPHIGWNELLRSEGADWSSSLLKGIPEGTAAYFVHSFMAVPENRKNLLAHCLYDGREVTAAIRKKNIFGTQFHPERSGIGGLKMLSDFISLPL